MLERQRNAAAMKNSVEKRKTPCCQLLRKSAVGTVVTVTSYAVRGRPTNLTETSAERNICASRRKKKIESATFPCQ